jgi:hypothetical protein
MLQVSRTLTDKVNKDESSESHMRHLDGSHASPQRRGVAAASLRRRCGVAASLRRRGVVAASRRRCVKFTDHKVRVAAASNRRLKTGLGAGADCPIRDVSQWRVTRVCGPLLNRSEIVKRDSTEFC